MSYLQKAKDFKDRIQGKPQSGVIRTGIRSFKNAGRRPGGSGGGGKQAKPGSGINLQYKNLQPDREFEAVLDDIDASSEPVFSSKGPTKPARPPAPPPVARSDGSTGSVGLRNSSLKAKSAADTGSLFPSSFEEDDDRTSDTVDPLLGVVTVTESHTDSEEESDDLELDAETVNVVESLQLTGKEPRDGEAAPGSGGSLVEGGKEGGERVEGGKEGGERVEGGKEGGEGVEGEEVVAEKSKSAVDNESANNNTLIHKKEETLPTDSDNNILQTDTRDAHKHSPKTGLAVVSDNQPTLDDLLEYGSAALSSRGSPHQHHCHMSPLPSPPQDGKSPLTSSNETDPHNLFHEDQSRHTATTSDVTSPGSAPQPQSTTVASHRHSRESGSSDREAKEDRGRETDEGDDLFADQTTQGPSPVEIPAHGKRVQSDRMRGDDKLGLSPASDHPLDHSDEDDVHGVRESVKETSPSKSSAAAAADEGEDELFPDDAKLLQDTVATAQKNSGQTSQNNKLEIRENYFSSSPGEQRKKTESRPTSDPAPASSGKPPGRQNSSGKIRPPRPPRSPLLASRLKLRQTREEKTHSNSQLHMRHEPPTASHREDHHTQRDGAKSVQGLGGSGGPVRTSPGKLASEVDHPELRGSLASEVASPPAESVTSSLDSTFLRSVSSPLSPETAEEHTSVVTSQQSHVETAEPPLIPLSVHLLIVGLLYFYYTFNPFVYVAGLLAGFLAFYLCLGAVFVAYVQKEEESAEAAAVTESAAEELSLGFMKSMSIRLDDYKTRFLAPSPKFKYRFMATLQYDFATHHRRDRLQCRLELVGDFELHIRVLDAEGDILVKKAFDLSRENCRITISPQDVFENRKRRWSKKYPIRLEIGSFEIFLFANVSRFKQEWFFRLREAVQGTKTEELIKKQKEFYRYMQRYFPPEPLRHTSLHTASMSSHRSATASTSATQRTARQHAQRKHRAHVDVGAVQFSSTSTIEEEDEASGGSISISQSQGPGSRHYQREHSVASSTLSAGTSVSEHTGRPLPTHSLSTTSGTVGTSFSSFPEPPLLGSSNWINALTARLYWDVWHETRWKDWIVSRIQRKLVRIKTPRFLDPLQLTDIAIGDSMPVINRLYEGPFLRPDGVWVYLDVTYEGLFVMTIKTKLKLGQGKGEEEEKGRELKSVKHLASLRQSMSHSQAAHVFQDSNLEPDNDSETGSEDESTHPFTAAPVEEDGDGEDRAKLYTHTGPASTDVQPANKKKERGARLKRVVTKITKRVASNRLVRRAAEKASSVPLELTVEVKRLKGVLAVNIPPPPADTIWYGFLTTPKLELVAKPRLGKKAVTLSQVTHWIERKLCALVDEKLTLPNMEDLVVPILNSGLPEDTQNQLSSPNPNL